MADSQLSVTQFVRGMAWHDLGKPFALGTAKHTALGYWLLRMAGYDGEALVTLAHGRTREYLGQYLNADGTPLPSVLSLCNPLDRLAASSYSMQSRGLQTDRHSLQNPFSRLPVSVPGWTGPFAVTHSDLNGSFEPAMWEHLREALPHEWRSALTEEAKERAEDRGHALLDPAQLPAGADAVGVLWRYMAHYPERTYPAVNDTSLAQHCRLSGILALVVHRNLEHSQDKDWLEDSIRLDNDQLVQPISDAPRTVRENLQASLVRIAFEGHRVLYENAVRVDDLHGARELADRTRDAFKTALAAELGAPELTEFLAISESQFDLVFLLPSAVEPLDNLLQNAYEKAMGQITTQIAGRLEQSFPHFTQLRGQLRQQLSEVGYGVRIIPVAPPSETIFDEFAAQYGSRLLQAYIDSQDYVTFRPANLSEASDWRDPPDSLAAAETCQVCGNFPILTPPQELSDEDKNVWLRKRDYAAHVFRGEPEELCISCVARRTLAYGKIAKRMDPIVHSMLTQVRSGYWHSISPPDGPELPPLLSPSLHLSQDDEMANLDAFYVRYRQAKEGVDRSALDIFPTTSYAADATGNVALLALQPSRRVLFGGYAYDEAIDFESDGADVATCPAVQLWQDTFVSFYKTVRDNPKTSHLAEPIRHGYPHLARVMERIQRIRAFYEDLYHRLAEAPFHSFPRLRVLPLDTGFPTLRLLLPAADLDKALQVLDRVITESLFSATYFEDLKERRQLHKLLELLAPDLLHGVAILFKHKHPLYLALEAERDLFRQLQASDPSQRLAGRPGNAQWYGLRLAFSDLRGSLSQVAPKLAEVTYAGLGPVLELAKKVDRRTVLLRAGTAEHISPELADALTLIRADRIRLGRAQAQALSQEETFPPVLYLKRATRG